MEIKGLSNKGFYFKHKIMANVVNIKYLLKVSLHAMNRIASFNSKAPISKKMTFNHFLTVILSQTMNYHQFYAVFTSFIIETKTFPYDYGFSLW